MAWLLVLQPNQKFGIFSTIVDGFVKEDLNEKEVVAVYVKQFGTSLQEKYIREMIKEVKEGKLLGVVPTDYAYAKMREFIIHLSNEEKIKTITEKWKGKTKEEIQSLFENEYYDWAEDLRHGEVYEYVVTYIFVKLGLQEEDKEFVTATDMLAKYEYFNEEEE